MSKRWVIGLMMAAIVAAALFCVAPGADAVLAAAPAPDVRAVAPAVDAPAFDAARARAHAAALAKLGARRMGTKAESRGLAYATGALTSVGYTVTTQSFRLPNGRRSRNVIAVKPGASERRIVIGAHADTKRGTPGANDNGSGVGTLLELARVMRDAETSATLVFVVFGAEEMYDRNPSRHHYGSKAFVRGLDAAARAQLSGMVSIDMVGCGSTFVARSMGKAAPTVVGSLRAQATTSTIALGYLRDGARYGSSDHEPFEAIGVPSAWIQWRTDSAYHTKRDRIGRVSGQKLGTTGTLLAGWLSGMSGDDLAGLRP